MHTFPFELPQSLAGYIDTYEDEPDKTILKLEKHLSRRGYDAVGSFLLAWFYLRQENRDKAVDLAHRAKTFAPGSPFLEYLHYFLVHPGAFDAWKPESIHRDDRARYVSKTKDFLLDLERLIGRLSKAEKKDIKPDNNADDNAADADLSDTERETGKLASMTLVDIHTTQGRYELALSMLDRLAKHPNAEPERIDQKREAIQERMKSEENEE